METIAIRQEHQERARRETDRFILDEVLIIPGTWLQDRRLSNIFESRQAGYANIHRYKSAALST